MYEFFQSIKSKNLLTPEILRSLWVSNMSKWETKLLNQNLTIKISINEFIKKKEENNKSYASDLDNIW